MSPVFHLTDATFIAFSGTDAIAEFTQILKLCKQSGDTSGIFFSFGVT